MFIEHWWYVYVVRELTDGGRRKISAKSLFYGAQWSNTQSGQSSQHWALLTYGSHLVSCPILRLPRPHPPLQPLCCFASCPLITGQAHCSSGHIINVALTEATSLPYPTVPLHPTPLIFSHDFWPFPASALWIGGNTSMLWNSSTPCEAPIYSLWSALSATVCFLCSGPYYSGSTEAEPSAKLKMAQTVQM